MDTSIWQTIRFNGRLELVPAFRNSLYLNLYKTDTSVKRTPRVGSCLSLLPLFDSLKDGHHTWCQSQRCTSWRELTVCYFFSQRLSYATTVLYYSQRTFIGIQLPQGSSHHCRNKDDDHNRNATNDCATYFFPHVSVSMFVEWTTERLLQANRVNRKSFLCQYWGKSATRYAKLEGGNIKCFRNWSAQSEKTVKYYYFH